MGFLSWFGNIAGPAHDKVAEAQSNWENQTVDSHNKKETDIQREFARHGIQWKVEDARAAGIAPLAALGASTYQYQPNFIGGDNVSRSGSKDWTAPIGNFLLNMMGQNVAGPALRNATMGERQVALEGLQLKQAELSVQNQALQNEMLATRVAEMRSATQVPAFPSSGNFISGQGNSGPVKDTPLSRVMSMPGNPAQEVGSLADYGFSKTAGGGLAIIPSKDVKERIEDQLVPETAWALRNQLMPNLTKFPSPDPKYYPLPRGATHWEWSPTLQEFRPAFRDSVNRQGLFPRIKNFYKTYKEGWEY